MSDFLKVCITGAGGFVGKALCKQLLAKNFQVHAIGRQSYTEIEELGAISHKIDISKDIESLTSAFKNADAVFHVASKVDMWGPYQEFYETNVVGTRNIIAACKQAGVKKLIYTSSPSVVADGSDLRNIDETYPIPKKHKAPYPATKAIAESEVLANNSTTLKTIALRPHLIFGPGDNHFIPTILERARQGRLIIVGGGNNVVDVCFIEDCIAAHIAAYEALSDQPESSGKAYFISQGDPVKLWEFINTVVQAHGLPALSRRIPKSIALCLAGIFELLAKISPIKIKPLFTRFLVSEMTTDHFFNIDAARKYLRFRPKYSVIEAINKSFK